MIAASAVLAGILVFLILKCRYRRDFYQEHKKDAGRFPALFCCGLFAADYYLRHHRPDPAEQELQEVFLMSREAQEIALAKRFGRMLLLLFTAALLSLLAALPAAADHPVRALLRPAFGQTREVDLLMEDGKKTEKVRVSVSGREPSGEELQAFFDESFSALQPVILNKNPSFSEVSEALKLPQETAEGIRISYESSDPAVLSDYGTVRTSGLPEEGALLELRVCLSYAGTEKSYTIPVRVVQKVPETEAEDSLTQLLSERDRTTRDSETLELPEEVDGRPVSWYPERLSPYVFLLIGTILMLWLFIYPRERMKERLRKRKEQLQSEYPGFVLKLRMFLHAGLSIRSAWERILLSQEQKKGPLYEEMLLAQRNMERGTAEEQAYLEFGRRCGLSCYRRLGNWLARNLRQGLSGAERMLEEEMEQALSEKRNRALRYGEEAGTKLLFPMGLMLCIVLIMLLVPAFMQLY